MASKAESADDQQLRHGWDEPAAIAARPLIGAALLYGTLAVGFALAAYWGIFNQFALYDDEGSLLVPLAAFVDGDALYKEIYSQYGPFYYEFFGGLFALTGQSVTTDASRLIVIVVWVAISIACGLTTHRLSGQLTLGAVAALVAFLVLAVLKAEPMHPHGLSLLLLSAIVLIAVIGPTSRPHVAGAACGAMLAALALTKVNLGGFAIAAVALAAVLTAAPLYRRTWLRWAVVAAFVLMPLLLIRHELHKTWGVELILIQSFAAVAVVLTALRARDETVDDDALWRWLRAGALGLAVASASILGAILLTGPSPGDVYTGMIAEAARLSDAFVIPFILDSGQVYLPILGAAVAALLAVRSRRGAAAGIWPGILRIAAGVVIWLAVAQVAPFSHELDSTLLAVVLALAWVPCAAPAGLSERPYRRFVRVLLPALAVAEGLQVYPVAGNQIGVALLLFVPVGGLCIADGLWCLRRWSSARWSRAQAGFRLVTAAVIAALGAWLAVGKVIEPAADARDLYESQPSLALHGAGRLHLHSDQAATYARMVELLKLHRCTAFAAYPSVNSLYLWSEIPPTQTQLPGAWVTLLDAEQQQRAVDELRDSPRPCAIRVDPLAKEWLRAKPRPNTPLVRYIFEDFREVDRIGDYRFLLPRSRG